MNTLDRRDYVKGHAVSVFYARINGDRVYSHKGSFVRDVVWLSGPFWPEPIVYPPSPKVGFHAPRKLRR